jgi:hypothetical protein
LEFDNKNCFRVSKRQKLLNNHTDKNPVMLLNELRPGDQQVLAAVKSTLGDQMSW